MSVAWVTEMSPGTEKRRAAATCGSCGEIGIVRVWEDGTIQPVGQSSFCGCSTPRIQLLET
ncbi:hypothetical protein B2G88_17900 [Natronolimnobius baerhuensis]|uniref:Uncharacterized protein n=1 Tax=Natronolimnobius baerhuensis TaxID=253108 RepID=A0A202E5T7_9EURY|nr:hypothetical protein B2G88_17900 [Natronolimnobius baerhuensis]